MRLGLGHAEKLDSFKVTVFKGCCSLVLIIKAISVGPCNGVSDCIRLDLPIGSQY